ncbi:hypothetical protein VNO80_09534 [Phaseolus coccineus]|uniref:Encoded peptide n=1 Tax=Phaseolus coccineus TaxID=3886 RepID=A0AAN9RCL3_PHACN
MAQNKFMVSFILVALIISWQGFQSIEGRHLKSEETIQHQMQRILTTNVAPLDADFSPPTPPPAAVPGRDVDSFRPTGPGHSPGVGHSVNN